MHRILAKLLIDNEVQIMIIWQQKFVLLQVKNFFYYSLLLYNEFFSH